MSNNKGVAMIVAVVMAMIFLMLVIAVSAISTSAYKKAHFYKDRAIALNLAEAGIADALYRMNYKNYSTATFAYFNDIDNFHIDEDFAGGSYQVVYTQVGANEDTIESTGKHKGRMRKIIIKVRGTNSGGVGDGIAEAFNKHAVYAGTVVKTGGTWGTVDGNIASTTDLSGETIPTSNGNSKIQDTNIDNTYFPSLILTPTALPSVVWVTYTEGDTGVPDGAPYDFDGAYGASTYDGAGTYTFANGATIANSPKLNRSAGAATIILNDVTINVGQVIGTDNGSISATNSTITNDLIVSGGALTLDGATVNGRVVCDNDITLSGAASTIDASATASTYEAPILANAGGDADIIIQDNAPDITLDSGQEAVVIAYSNGGAVTVTVNANLTPTLSGGQAGIIAFADSANNATITIGTAAADVNGLIYAYGNSGNDGDITLDASAGDISGALVACDAVTLDGGTLTWDSSRYKSSSYPLYANFSGGRRVYLPVIGSWKEE